MRSSTFCLCMCLLGSTSKITAYQTVIDLGTLGGTMTYPRAINASGQVVGFSQISENAGYHAFSYANGVMTDLQIFSAKDSWATGINDQGNICGYYSVLHSIRGWVRSGTVTTSLSGYGSNTYVMDINNKGQVVGSSYDSSGQERAYLYANGGYKYLGSLGGVNSQAYAINDAGRIVGNSNTNVLTPEGWSTSRPFAYDGTVMKDLGSLGGYIGDAKCVNEDGITVGFSNTGRFVTSVSGVREEVQHAFVYNAGLSDLGTLGGWHSVAWGINASGVIVGSSSVPDNTAFHAVRWVGNSILDLNSLVDPDSGWVLRSAQAINDSGYIVGDGTLNGLPRAFIMIPEPASILVCGLLFFTRCHRKSLRA